MKISNEELARMVIVRLFINILVQKVKFLAVAARNTRVISNRQSFEGTKGGAPMKL